MEQTTPLKQHKVTVPILALGGGEKGVGERVAQMVEAVAANVTGKVVPNCGHFIPEEQPLELVRLLQAFADGLPSS